MARQALGRGLQMLIPKAQAMPTDAEPESGARELPTSEIVANPFQPRQRFSPQELQELADSIGRHGILQPLVVRQIENGYQCVLGERRLRAARMAGLTVVPVLVREFSDQQMLQLAIVENAQREDLSPLESAFAYRRLLDEFGMTQQEVAKVVGKSRAAIANTVRLLELPEPIREALSGGAITEGHARAILTAGDEEAMLTAWSQLEGTDTSVRETERLARAIRDGQPPETAAVRTKSAASRPLDPNVAQVLDRVQRRIGTKVVLTPKKTGGTLAIEYYSDEDLTRITDLLLGPGEGTLD